MERETHKFFHMITYIILVELVKIYNEIITSRLNEPYKVGICMLRMRLYTSYKVRLTWRSEDIMLTESY